MVGAQTFRDIKNIERWIRDYFRIKKKDRNLILRLKKLVKKRNGTRKTAG